MESLLQYKCPNCGGTIEFDSKTQKPKCPFCDTEFDIADLKAYDDELKGDKADEVNWQTSDEQWAEQEADENGMKIFVCTSCGGEVVVEETAAARKCPWCDSPIVIKGSVAGSLRPKYVIPFKYDKEAAKAAYKEHLAGKKFLPAVFSSENHIDEIQGIYVPFWLFDAKASSAFRLRGIRTRTWIAGDYRYHEVDHYALIRKGNLEFENIPVDASEKMADDLMDSLEPFDFTEMLDFQTAYLSGFLADKYDVTMEDSQRRANVRMKSTAQQMIMTTAGDYHNISVESGSVQVKNGQVDYVLLPVWLLNTTWNGTKYVFAMNGQTGKLVGNLPCDKKAKAKYFWLTFLIAGAIGFAAALVFWLLNSGI